MTILGRNITWKSIEVWFLTVTRVLFFVIAFVAFSVTAFTAIGLVSDYFATPDVQTEIDRPALSDYQNVVRDQEADDKRVEKRAEEEAKKKKEAPEQKEKGVKKPEKEDANLRFNKIVEEIFKNLRIYAAELGEDPIDDKRLRRFLVTQVNKKIWGPDFWIVIEGLNTEVKKLRDKAEDIVKLDRTSPRRINSREFVVWYFTQYEQRYREAEEYKETEEMRVAAAKLGMLQRLYVLGGAFGAFILMTILLVIFRIEANTRVLNEVDVTQRKKTRPNKP
jgi:hypothetical protein